MKDNTPSGPPKKSDYNFGFGHNDAANYERDLKMYNDKMNQENKSVEEIAKEYADKEADPMFSHLSSENNSIKRHFKAGFLAASSKGKEEEIEVRVPKLWPPDKQGWYWCVVQGRPKALGMKLVKLEYGEDDLGNVGFLQEDDDFIVLYYLTSGIKDNPPAPKLKDTSGMQEAIELLKEYEQWEADIISCDEMWWPKNDKDALPTKIYEKMLDLQRKRNSILHPEK